jgi:hypothetical protein
LLIISARHRLWAERVAWHDEPGKTCP